MTEIENVKDAILTAIQMEKDGYSFYMKAAAQTSSDMGKTIFESLAEDEQKHLDVFQKMFEDTVGQSEWNDLINSSKKYASIPIFPADLTDDPAAEEDIKHWAKHTGHEILSFEKEGTILTFYIKKMK